MSHRLAGTLLWAALVSTTALSASSLMGCAVDEDDLERWETTLGGPNRLSAVVIFDKYPHPLRVQAAMSLIDMKPRKGRHVGIERLVKGALVCDPEFMDEGEPCMKKQLGAEERHELLQDLVPLIIAELKKPPPEPAQGGQAAPDPSFKYKDAAYLMLTYEEAQVIPDADLRNQLEEALTEWAMADFDNRLNDRTQAFGMEQLLRHIGPSSVKKLPSLMEKEGRNLSKMADIISKIADEETRERASERLVEIAKYVSSEQWRKDRLPELREANRKAGFDPTDKQLNKQMAGFQNESITRIFASMKKVGGSAVVSYALDVAGNEKVPMKRRQTALAALEGHISRKNDKHIARLFDLATSKSSPPEVVDQAFRRIRELPRDKVIDKLYGFFDSDDWKIRRLAGATILQMSKVEQADEFLRKLDREATKNFNLPEAITYGAYLAGLKGDDILETLEPHMKKGGARSRLAALSYWYDKGTKKDLSKIEPFENDRQRVPECEDEDRCDWSCVVTTGNEKESKKVETVGDFVSYCIKPKMIANEPDEPKDEEGSRKDKKQDGTKKEDGKDDK